jgi:predicted Zn-dependent protease
MNPFNVLEIPTTASPEDIKAAYHRLAKRWHPDRFTGEEKVEAENRFRELAEAFSILKDPAKRMSLQQQMPQPSMAPTPTPELAKERTAEDWAGLAKVAFEEGKLDQARALIHYAIRLDEGNAQYHSLLASILEREGGDLRAVVKALESAVRLAPRDVECHMRLATHFLTLGLSARSQRHIQMARELAPNHPKLRQLDSKAAKKLGATSLPKPAGKTPVLPVRPLDQLMDQLKVLWSRLTGKG